MFIDDKSQTTWLYLLTSKSKILIVFKEFTQMVYTQYGARIKILCTENGTEYINHSFESFLKSLAIVHQTLCVKTPQQNGGHGEETLSSP